MPEPQFECGDLGGGTPPRLTGDGLSMAHEKNFKTWKRQHRRRKAAKEKMKLYEQGKLTYDQLPALAREFVARKRNFLLKSA